jgi:hypothetical protein
MLHQHVTGDHAVYPATARSNIEIGCLANTPELHHAQLLPDGQTVTTLIPSDLALSIIASSRQSMPCALRLAAIAM